MGSLVSRGGQYKDNEVMPKRKPLDLSALDDRLLDGLKFCLKVYDLFDQVRSEPDGLGKIRLLKAADRTESAKAWFF